jgi:hypothetical protein
MIATLSPRALTPFEQTCVDEILKLGAANEWEYAGYLRSSDGPLIDLVTEKLRFRAEPTQQVHDAISSGAKVVVHHNHLSQESLSMADWNGTALLFDEIFAHSADGSQYHGRVIDRKAVKTLFHDAEALTIQVQSELAAHLRGLDEWDLSTLLGVRFGQEVINRALQLKGYVEYRFKWGSVPMVFTHPVAGEQTISAGILGSHFDSVFDTVAAIWAGKI